MKTHYRTHNCGELRINNVGESVVLTGWIRRIRELGPIIFIDLRDRYGITQLKIENTELIEKVKNYGREYVIQAKGKVIERESKNPNLPTGDIEVDVVELNLLNKSELPPFLIEDETDAFEDLRLKHRYLDLRRPIMQKHLLLRAKLYQSIRRNLEKEGFLEVETPFFIKTTPEGARDFIVPSRLYKGNFFALPQSPQIFKQLLMVAGIDRYFQITRCFRDEDLRGDRQPEFTQLDCEMSFVTQDDVLQTFERLVKQVYKEVLDIDLGEEPFKRLPYKEAIENYGIDKPDLRFDMKIKDVSNKFVGTEFKVFRSIIEQGGKILSLVLKGKAPLSRKKLDKINDYVRKLPYEAKGITYIQITDEGFKSPIAKFFTEGFFAELSNVLSAEKGDIIFLLAHPDVMKGYRTMAELRLHLAEKYNLYEKEWDLHWVIDFPLFERNQETGEIISMHHPFTMPNPEDLHLLDSEPLKVRAWSYDMVINGNEILSGSIRIHEPELQRKIFRILGLPDEEIEQKFGFMINAFKYGAPPHGGLAFGIDRWVMLMAKQKTIREVIAFPKNSKGRDMMLDAPAPVDEELLKELGISIEK